MARRFTESEPELKQFESFAQVERLIYSTFDKIISTATERRDRLFAELYQMKLSYIEKEEIRTTKFIELQKIHQNLIGRNVQHLEAKQMLREEIRKITASLKLCENPTQLPFPSLVTDGLQLLLQQLESFAHVQGTAGPYNDKTKPYKICGKRGKGRGEFNDPKGIALDGNRRIFVADFMNQRVQVLSPECKFIAEFGDTHLFRPYGISLYRDWIFVGDKQLGIVFKFLQTNYKMVSKSGKGKLNSPNGLTVDGGGEVLVADCYNNRIAVLNSELKFISEIGKDTLKYPQDVKINTNKVFVVDNNIVNNLHIFSKTGEILKNIINFENGSQNIFFCFDLYNNILVSDLGANSIQIYTMDGKLIHRIESSSSPTGIAVTDNFNIISTRFYLYTCDIRFY